MTFIKKIIRKLREVKILKKMNLKMMTLKRLNHNLNNQNKKLQIK